MHVHVKCCPLIIFNWTAVVSVTVTAARELRRGHVSEVIRNPNRLVRGLPVALVAVVVRGSSRGSGDRVCKSITVNAYAELGVGLFED